MREKVKARVARWGKGASDGEGEGVALEGM